MADGETYLEVCRGQEVICIDKQKHIAACGTRYGLYNYDSSKYKIPDGMQCTGFEVVNNSTTSSALYKIKLN